jgi:hypothetical protein
VLLGVMLRRVVGVVLGMSRMTAGGMSMMRGGFVVALFMILSRLLMMLGGLFVMLSRLLVVRGSFVVRHGALLIDSRR